MAVLLCICHKTAISRISWICKHKKIWLCYKSVPMSSYFSRSFWMRVFHHFLNPFLFFASHTFWGAFRAVVEKEAVYSPSAVTFALTFDSPLPLSLPSSPDKKEPLLRCFVRHYKTVAMDTQSEQAPYTGSRRGNDRCNISHIRNSLFTHQHTGWWAAVFQMPKIKTQKKQVSNLFWSKFDGHLLLAPQRWVKWYFPPHLVFVVSPWRDDLYYQGWEIKEGFLTDLMKLASYKPRELVLIAQLPHCSAKCG